MSEADATLARLLEADRRFTELSKQHLACGGDVTLAGDHQVTMFRCLICGEVFSPSPDEFFDVAGIEASVGRLWARDVNQICNGLLDEVVRRAGRVLPDDATAVIVKFD